MQGEGKDEAFGRQSGGKSWRLCQSPAQHSQLSPQRAALTTAPAPRHTREAEVLRRDANWLGTRTRCELRKIRWCSVGDQLRWAGRSHLTFPGKRAARRHVSKASGGTGCWSR